MQKDPKGKMDIEEYLSQLKTQNKGTSREGGLFQTYKKMLSLIFTKFPLSRQQRSRSLLTHCWQMRGHSQIPVMEMQIGITSMEDDLAIFIRM